MKVRHYPDGELAIFHGRLCLGRYASNGVPLGAPQPKHRASTTVASRHQPGAVLAAVKDAARRDAVASPRARPSCVLGMPSVLGVKVPCAI